MTLLAIAIPLFMAVGAIAAFVISRNRQDQQPGGGWQDTSLDDWRRERDESAALERQTRATTPTPDDTAETASEDAEDETFELY